MFGKYIPARYKGGRIQLESEMPLGKAVIVENGDTLLKINNAALSVSKPALG